VADKEKKHKKAFDRLPFPPLALVETAGPIEAKALKVLIAKRPEGLSVCIRSNAGHADRGGYFFHFSSDNRQEGSFRVFNFEGIYVISFNLDNLTRFVNHCAGLQFDQEMFNLCQSQINFRLDPQQSPEQEEESRTLSESGSSA
jgi:hypothetical protein